MSAEILEFGKKKETVGEGSITKEQNGLSVITGKKRGDIKLVRLITGEVIIAYYNLDKVNLSFSLYKPLLIGMSMDQYGNPQVNMIEYMPMAKNDTFYFQMDHLLNEAEPQEQLANFYRQKTSGLVTPAANQLVGFDK